MKNELNGERKKEVEEITAKEDRCKEERNGGQKEEEERSGWMRSW